MTTYRCRRCGSEYGRDNDLDPAPSHDPDWGPADGRCYTCYLSFCYDLYGGIMEPCFTLNGSRYTADGFFASASGDEEEGAVP